MLEVKLGQDFPAFAQGNIIEVTSHNIISQVGLKLPKVPFALQWRLEIFVVNTWLNTEYLSPLTPALGYSITQEDFNAQAQRIKQVSLPAPLIDTRLFPNARNTYGRFSVENRYEPRLHVKTPDESGLFSYKPGFRNFFQRLRFQSIFPDSTYEAEPGFLDIEDEYIDASNSYQPVPYSEMVFFAESYPVDTGELPSFYPAGPINNYDILLPLDLNQLSVVRGRFVIRR